MAHYYIICCSEPYSSCCSSCLFFAADDEQETVLSDVISADLDLGFAVGGDSSLFQHCDRTSSSDSHTDG